MASKVRPLHRRSRLAGLVTLGLVAGMFAMAPAASAGVTKCQAENVTQGTKESPDLANLITAANADDTIQVKGTCVGNFTITKNLNLFGKPTKDAPSPALAGPGTGLVLIVWTDGQLSPDLQVTLTGLTITGGNNSAGSGGGIANLGSLTLTSSFVTGNSGLRGPGGGIWNVGSLTLNSSSVTGNSARGSGGGVFNRGTVILNDSSVTKNSAGFDGGGIANLGTLTLIGSSSVSGNRADSNGDGTGEGGGINGCATGASDGVNVFDNYRGTGTTVDNMAGCA